MLVLPLEVTSLLLVSGQYIKSIHVRMSSVVGLKGYLRRLSKMGIKTQMSLTLK